ncbi:MAG: DNA mismatch endonuclease Vsr [Candidatus Competibacteraceae bacterium]|nr:DNA mismatch endonuclease Vsr [Candidatus Competibacteraceae bacterium]
MTEVTDLRRRTMRAVKSRDTKPEMIVRRLVHRAGHRYRLHRADLPGKPDLTFSKKKKIIFVHGCFWHGHNCKRGARQPRQNAEYWIQKISHNKERDIKEQETLQAMGWKVLVIWECQLKLKNREAVDQQIMTFLRAE